MGEPITRVISGGIATSREGKPSRSWLPVLRAAAVPAFNEVLFVAVESGSWVTRRIAGGAPMVDSGESASIRMLRARSAHVDEDRTMTHPLRRPPQ